MSSSQGCTATRSRHCQAGRLSLSVLLQARMISFKSPRSRCRSSRCTCGYPLQPINVYSLAHLFRSIATTQPFSTPMVSSRRPGIRRTKRPRPSASNAAQTAKSTARRRRTTTPSSVNRSPDRSATIRASSSRWVGANMRAVRRSRVTPCCRGLRG